MLVVATVVAVAVAVAAVDMLSVGEAKPIRVSSTLQSRLGSIGQQLIRQSSRRMSWSILLQCAPCTAPAPQRARFDFVLKATSLGMMACMHERGKLGYEGSW